MSETNPLLIPVENEYWACIIGPVNRANLPGGADLPPRMAAIGAVREMLDAHGGNYDVSCWSGWGVNQETFDAMQEAWSCRPAPCDPPHADRPVHDPWRTAHECVDEALKITSQDRNAAYDGPEDNFRRIALTWNALLDGKLTADITAGDVARMMTALKLVRDAHAQHRDNRVDGIGYLLCLERAEPTEAK